MEESANCDQSRKQSLQMDVTRTELHTGSPPSQACGQVELQHGLQAYQTQQSNDATHNQDKTIMQDDRRTSRPPRVDLIRRVCYFRMETASNTSRANLGQIDGSLCTHLILAFARINLHGQLVIGHETDQYYLKQVAEFKRKYPTVRVMISVENDCESQGFSMLAQSNNDQRYKFAKSVIEFLQIYNLDGVDLHWEYPNFPTSLFGLRGELERLGLTRILSALRSAIVETFFARQQCEQQQELSRRSSSRNGCATGSSVYSTSSSTMGNSAAIGREVEPHLLTVAIGGQETILRSSYELKQLVNLCDWLNVMSYDYFLFKPYLPFTGPNSPLHPIVEHYPILNKLALSWTIQRLLEEGLDKDKLVIGVSCYARAYRLVFRQTTPVPFTLALGLRAGQLGSDQLDYREVRSILAKPETIVEFDERARVPYLLTDSGYTWASYENSQSVREKVRYILDNELSGYMTWSLNGDDWFGCDETQDSNKANEQQQQQHQQINGCSKFEATSQVELETTTFPLHRAMLEEALKYQ